jgi:hypothetical protein
MGEPKSLELGTAQAGSGGCLVVTQMSMTGGNPALEPRWVGTVLEEMTVMVRFDDRERSSPKRFAYFEGQEPEVGEEGHVGAARSDPKSDRLVRVMGYRNRLECEIADFDPFPLSQHDSFGTVQLERS